MTRRCAPDTAVAERLASSEYLSADRAADDVDAALGSPDVERVLGSGVFERCNRFLLVASGGSYAAMLTVKNLLDRTDVGPVDTMPGLDVVWRQPAWLSPRCGVILVSYSGKTADVVDALAVVAQAGCPTVAITGLAGSPLDTTCDESIVYSGSSIYEVPVAMVLLLLAGNGPASAANVELTRALRDLPPVLRAAAADARTSMYEVAVRLVDVDHLYVLAGGPLSPLGFKLAPVFMENARIGATHYDAAEFRHGSIEFLERHDPTVLGLLGIDESRQVTAGVLRFAADHGSTVEVIDAAQFAVPYPMLAPLVLNGVTQWLVAWSAALRGIDDLDERVFMGKGVLSSGAWP